MKEAEAKLEAQAKQDAMTAKEKIAKGSLGFFKEMGCQEAVDRIEEYPPENMHSIGCLGMKETQLLWKI